jgi:hypothetical protein
MSMVHYNSTGMVTPKTSFYAVVGMQIYMPMDL